MQSTLSLPPASCTATCDVKSGRDHGFGQRKGSTRPLSKAVKARAGLCIIFFSRGSSASRRSGKRDFYFGPRRCRNAAAGDPCIGVVGLSELSTHFVSRNSLLLEPAAEQYMPSACCDARWRDVFCSNSREQETGQPGTLAEITVELECCERQGKQDTSACGEILYIRMFGVPRESKPTI